MAQARNERNGPHAAIRLWRDPEDRAAHVVAEQVLARPRPAALRDERRGGRRAAAGVVAVVVERTGIRGPHGLRTVLGCADIALRTLEAVPAVVSSAFKDVDLLPAALSDVVEVEGVGSRPVREPVRVAQSRRVGLLARTRAEARCSGAGAEHAARSTGIRVVRRDLTGSRQPEHLAAGVVQAPRDVVDAAALGVIQGGATAVADGDVQQPVARDVYGAGVVELADRGDRVGQDAFTADDQVPA